MKTYPLGISGLQAPAIGFGAWAIGGGPSWGQETREDEAIRAIHAAVDCGVNLIDTAPAYGYGRSERIVGKAIRDIRDKVVLATKFGLWWQDFRGAPFCELDGKLLRRSLRPDTIRIEVEHSLTRLQTDHIDLYQVHWPAVPPCQTPIGDTMACLMTLKDQGKIGAIGVCNVTARELNKYRHAGPVASVQFRYSMLNRQAEQDVLPYCSEHHLAALAYMSIEQGLLTGKIRMDRVFSEKEFRSNAAWNPWFGVENRKRILDLLSGWMGLTKKYDCTLTQLVIAWTLAQSGVTTVLCGARNERQVMENAYAAGLCLTREDLKQIGTDLKHLGVPHVESRVSTPAN
jgi:methylglyoxal reductase